MRYKVLALAWLACIFSSSHAFAQLRSNTVVSGLTQPVAFVQDPSDPSVQYVVEQVGRIRVVRNGALQTTPFLDVSAQITSGGERGLLNIALPSDYGTSGRFFVYFTDPNGNIVVARFKRSASTNPLTADPATRLDLQWSGGLRVIPHPVNANHNGGMMAFGPDGNLYLGVGDGGAGDDPPQNAQNLNVLLGKILRINVSVPDSNLAGLSIPADNPFPTGARPELWDIGLRNPWKFSFDDPAHGGTGALVIGDVGQNLWEEVDYEPAGRGHNNYGWRVREGAHDHLTTPAPAFLPLVDPIFEYPHPTGFSITGGYVYRGTALGTTYRGRYFFADFVNAKVWSVALTINPGTGTATASDVRDHTAELAPGNISAFGVDAAGELYLVSYGGRIARVSATGAAVTPLMSIDFPARGQSVAQPFQIAGWALDPVATADPGIDAIHVWAYPIPAIGSPTTGDPVFVGATSVGIQRPDVAQAFGGNQFAASGFDLSVQGLGAGTYRFAVFALVHATGRFDVLRTVDVTIVQQILIAVDTPDNGSSVAPDFFLVGGWALDASAPSGTGVDAIHVWAVQTTGGPFVFLGATTTFSDRADVGSVYGTRFTHSGYVLTATAPRSGTWDMFVYARSTVTGQFQVSGPVRIIVP
jgi:glucose/arabinose dehydrogenase